MRLLWLLSCACLALACDRGALRPATQALVTVHSDLGDDLARVEVRLFDVREERSSDGHDFELSSELTLPLSFAIVPADEAPATRLLVVVSGKSALGETIAQSKVIVALTAGQLRALDLWLLEACRAVTCDAAQTCGVDGTTAGECNEVPLEEGRRIRRGEEHRDPTPAPKLTAPTDGEPDGGGTMPEPLPDASADAALPLDAPVDASDVTGPLDATLDAAPRDGGPVVDADAMQSDADPLVPLVPCAAESTQACGSFMAELEVVQLGPLGAIMEVNQGTGYENALRPSDTQASCTATIRDAYGYAENDAAFLAAPAGVDLRLYTIYRPANWRRDARYPIVLWANGACFHPESYGGLLRYIASHGFVVFAPNARTVSDGSEQLNALRFATALNTSSGSPYYQRLDLTRVAAIGQPESSAAAAADARITTAVLRGPGTLGKAYLMIGTDFTTGHSVNTLMSALNQASAGAYMFLRMNSYSGELVAIRQPTRMANVITSWLKYRLQNDPESRAMFVGASCTLCTEAAQYSYAQRGLN